MQPGGQAWRGALESEEGAELETDLGSTQLDALQALLGCSTVTAEPRQGVVERDAIPIEWLRKKKEVRIPPLRHVTGEGRKRSKAQRGRAFTAPLRPLETAQHLRAGGKELLKEDRLKMPQGES